MSFDAVFVVVSTEKNILMPTEKTSSLKNSLSVIFLKVTCSTAEWGDFAIEIAIIANAIQLS
jgi:hypothetical protein